jgi:hypothetical protein
MIFEEEKKPRDEIRERLEKRKIRDFKQLCKSEVFRRFLWELQEESGLFHNPVTGDNLIYFYAGKREMGLLIMQKLKHCPEVFSQMQREHLDEVTQLKYEREKLKNDRQNSSE